MFLRLCLAVATIGGDMVVRKSEERGRGDHGWLVSQHTFSFADYHDPAHMNFHALQVINEDIVAPKKGFDTHPHKDMEIITYILEGTLEHKDTMGNHSQIRKGEFQLMSAGKGVQHSEFNPSDKEKVHLLQIWIRPQKKGLKPSYQQQSFEGEGLRLVLSPTGEEGSLQIHQNTKVYLGRFEKGGKAELAVAPGRHAWIQVAKGAVQVNGVALKQGDGAELSGNLVMQGAGEWLVFDLP